MALLARLRLVVALGTLAPLPAPAQTIRQFDTMAKRDLPRVYSNAHAVADFTGRGRLDVLLVSGSSPPGNVFLINDGPRGFHLQSADHPWDSYSAVAAGDLDGDGDVDAVVGTLPGFHSGQTRLFLNDGRGRLRDATVNMPKDADWTEVVALGDVDGDRDLDIVVGNGQFGTTGRLQTRLYLNDGKARFADTTSTHLPRDADDTHALALGDVDGDRDLDLLVGNAGLQAAQTNRLYLNDGRGHFSDATSTKLWPLAEFTVALALHDFDGDGDLDLVEGNSSEIHPNRIRRNQGDGTFDVSAALPPALDYTRALAVGDVDGDGDPDLVVSNWGPDRVYLNNGRGLFIETGKDRLPSGRAGHTGMSLADFDADGDLDLFGGGGLCKLYVNDRQRRFMDATAQSGPAPLASSLDGVTVGDLDRDGDLDLVYAVPHGRNELHVGNGRGSFTEVSATHLPPDLDPSKAVVSADFDGDGDLDLAFANWTTRTTLYLNDGKARFTDASTRMPVTSSPLSCLEAGDVDGDGDLDLVVGAVGTANRIFINTGRGFFADRTASLLPADRDQTQDLALVDVDGDRDLDLVTANGNNYPSPVNEQNRLYLNDGKGKFTDATRQLPALRDLTFGVAIGDVDGDRDLDLLFANNGPLGNTVGEQNRLYLNDGRGRFADGTAKGLPAELLHSIRAAFADLDLDGSLDLVVAGDFMAFHSSLYLGDGRGRFRNATSERATHLLAAPGLAVADFDGDGDPDLLLGADLYVNRHRQIFTPNLARSGRHYLIEFYAEPGYASGLRVVLPLLGLQEVPGGIRVPPFGTLRLAPAGLLPLKALGVQSQVALRITVPADPALLDRPLLSQALVLHTSKPAGWRLSNFTRDRIFR